MREFELEVLDKKQVEALGSDLSENNDYITETAGYVPLEVKMKQFVENGMIAQFQSSDFTSTDYRNIYLNPDFEITPEDEFEDIQEKLQARNEFIKQLTLSKNAAKGGDVAESDKPAAKAAEQKETVDKEKSPKE